MSSAPAAASKMRGPAGRQPAGRQVVAAPRSRMPLLPELTPGVRLPRTLAAIVDGQPVFDCRGLLDSALNTLPLDPFGGSAAVPRVAFPSI